MSRFTKNKITTAISTVLLLSSSYAFAADNLMQQGDFEGSIDQWVNAGGTGAIVADVDLSSNVLQVSGRTAHSSASKYTVSNLVAGHTYRFTGKLKTDLPGQKVAMGTSYRLIDAGGDTFVTIGSAVDSSGDWIDYSATFTLPADFDDTKAFKIWIKSLGGTVSSVYGDDFLLVDLDGDNPPSQHSKTATYTDDAENLEHWTANDILGKKLDIMRLTHSDDLVNPTTGKTSFAQIDTWLTEEGNTDWRWATLAEMQAIHSFFDGEDNTTNIASFLQLNGGTWAPKDGTEEWTALIPTDSQSLDESTDPHNAPAYKIGVNNLTSSFGTVSYAKNFNSNGLVGAGLLVREVSDAVPLAITAPADVVIEATAAESAVTLGSPVIIGGTAPLQAAVADMSGPFAVGQHTVTWSVTDADQVLVTDTQTVTVTDTSEAVFEALADYEVEATSASTSVSLPPVNATDLVDGEILATNNAQESYSVGSHEITWSATDTAGNEATATQNLIIKDTTAPVFDTLLPIEIEINGGQANVIIPAVSATDAVDGSIVATRDLPDGSYDAGVYIINWEATDTAGQKATVTQSLIITDTSAAIVFDHQGALAAISEEATNNLTPVTLTAPTANDGAITATVDNTGPFGVGSHTINWTATDGEDSISQAQTVVITDSTAPVFAELADVHIEATGSDTDISLASISASDLVDGDVVATSDAPSTLQLGSHDITWTATDNAGNTSTTVQTVIVEDTTAPAFANVESLIVEATGVESALSLTPPVVTDLTDSAPVITNDAPEAFPLGDTSVTWTVEDAAGNISTVDQLITVQDTSAPIFSALPIVEFDATEAGTASVVIPAVFAQDSVSGVTAASADLTNGEYEAGTHTITWTVIDENGNEASTTQSIVVNAYDANPASSYSNADSFSNDESNEYWTINNIEGKKLDIMRLPASDDKGKVNASFNDLDTWLAENTDWRYGTYEELIALQAFFDLPTAADNGMAYYALNNSQWAPNKTFWNILIPTQAQDPADTGPAYGFLFSSTALDTVGYKKKFNVSALGAAALLVREIAEEIVDSDDDGYADSEDAFPDDVNEWLDTDDDGTGNNADTDDDNDGVSDESDAFPLDDSETIDTDGDGTGNNADTDDDGDSVADDSDIFPLDETESVDTDGDGTGNNADTDDDGDGVLDVDDAFPLDDEQWLDEEAPVLQVPADVTIDARGKVTLISQHSVGPLQATDNADGVIDAVVVGETKLPSGHHEVIWRATDRVGNFSEVTQIVNINPLVNFAMDKLAEPGSDVKARIFLSGEAPSYPVELELNVSGSAGEGVHNATSQLITIEDATETEFSFNVNSEADILGGETIALNLASATNAVLGSKVTHTTTLVAGNVAPIVRVAMTQGDKKTLVLSKDSSETVMITATVRDANHSDRGNHTLSWTASDPAIVNSLNVDDSSKFELDISALAPGIYSFDVAATEAREADALSTTTNFSFVIVESLPELIAQADSDNDGTLDTEEGTGDSDGDGIADYLDNDDDVSNLPLANGKSLRTQSGLQLKLGRATLIAKGLLAEGASITTDDLMTLGNNLGQDTSNVVDANYTAVSDIIDFELSGLLEVGTTASVVIPLAEGESIPAEAVYRKYDGDSGWSNFVADNDNTIASAPFTPAGLCPDVGSTDYVAGLNEGDNCIQVTLLDGGEYDQDGIANGVIVDPAKIATDARSFYAYSEVIGTEFNEGDMITLDVSSTVTGEQALTYTWKQVSGSPMNLPTDDATLTVTTEVPQVREDEDIVIEVTVSNGSQDDVTVMSFTALQTEAIITPVVMLHGANPDSGKLTRGATVSIDASGSFDSDFNSLTYTWTQTSGPQVILNDNQSVNPSFVVPKVASDARIAFEVTVSNGLDTPNATTTATISSTIEGDYEESSGGSTGLWTLLLAALGLSRRTRR